MTATLPSNGQGLAAASEGASEDARNLLAQKLHSLQHRKITPPSLAKQQQAPSASSSEGGKNVQAPTPSSVGPISEANPAPSTSINSGTPLPPLEPIAAPQPIEASELAKMHFAIAQKRIVSPASLQRWQSSDTFNQVLGFVMALNDAVVGHKLTDQVHQSEATRAIVQILDDVAAVIERVPPEQEGTSRFGNAAFRTFYAQVKEQSRTWHESIAGLKQLTGHAGDDGKAISAIDEIEVYFVESFGNEKRIDYGSGMELNFICWLLCMVKLGILDLQTESAAIVLHIFWRYIEVMRKIQSTYWLEPAGSHGVWGLDDYHFLPFLFGSAQLKSHRIFKPKSIHDNEILDDFSKEYMYFACIRFINSIKTASLRWHSPMLDDISGVKTWAKVNEGMLKMYKAEVMLKLPIAQHIFFGSLLPFPSAAEGDADEDEAALQRAVEQGGIVHTDENGQTHVHAGVNTTEGEHGAAQAASGWGDCCGIPVPSAFAAAQQEREKMRGAGGLRFDGSSGVRRIPFD